MQRRRRGVVAPASGFLSSADADLRQDLRNVELGAVWRYVEAFGDLTIGQALANERQYLLLAWRQQVRIWRAASVSHSPSLREDRQNYTTRRAEGLGVRG
jgi:hypothetical protein